MSANSIEFSEKSGNSSQTLASTIEFSENSGNSGQIVQYFSQMATLFVAFPEYSGYSNQFATSLWGFFRKFGKLLPKIHSFFCQRQNYWH